MATSELWAMRKIDAVIEEVCWLVQDENKKMDMVHALTDVRSYLASLRQKKAEDKWDTEAKSASH